MLIYYRQLKDFTFWLNSPIKHTAVPNLSITVSFIQPMTFSPFIILPGKTEMFATNQKIQQLKKILNDFLVHKVNFTYIYVELK